jgi:addiction module HigA family antidote
MKSRLEEIHPGEILSEEFMKPMGISPARSALDLDVPQAGVQDVLDGRSGITADMALRLSIYFRAEPRFWLNLQQEYDLRSAEAHLLPQIRDKLKPHVPDEA